MCPCPGVGEIHGLLGKSFDDQGDPGKKVNDGRLHYVRTQEDISLKKRAKGGRFEKKVEVGIDTIDCAVGNIPAKFRYTKGWEKHPLKSTRERFVTQR